MRYFTTRTAFDPGLASQLACLQWKRNVAGVVDAVTRADIALGACFNDTRVEVAAA